MPWQNSGGGGGNGGGGGPWGGGGGGGGNGQSPWGRPPQGPKFEDLFKRGQDKFRGVVPGGLGSGTGILLIGAAVLLLWLASGFYRVQPDEQGVILRFGAYNRTSQPGLNYHLPVPIETALTPKVTRVNRTEVGFRSGDGLGRGGGNRDVREEALMLTGDENIVDINFSVFWVIKDAGKFLFNIRAPEVTVKAGAESAMREVVGRTPIAAALAEGRGRIEGDTQKLLQEIMDLYGSGVEVTQVQLQKVDPPQPVIDAFRDVQRAKADQVRLSNDAETYRNGILPSARGEAVRLTQEAEGYRQQVVTQAEGDAQRFLAVYEAYKAAEDVTQRRLYIETMEQILKGANKILIDKSASGSGVLPYLPLPQIGGAPAPTPAPAPQAPANRGTR